jgi:hypothetical protein
MNKIKKAVVLLLLINLKEEKATNRNPFGDEFFRSFGSIASDMISDIESHFKRFDDDFKHIVISKEEDFPEATEVIPNKIEVKEDIEKNLLSFCLNTQSKILAKNIVTEKKSNQIFINIFLDNGNFKLILKEQEYVIFIDNNKKIKNSSNTRYASSSSTVSRKEQLSKYIDLDTVKLTVHSETGSIVITAQYIENKKNSDVLIEFK